MEGERREQEETVTASRPAEQAKDVRENAIEGREGRVRERGTASVYRLQRLFAVVAPFSLSDCVSTATPCFLPLAFPLHILNGNLYWNIKERKRGGEGGLVREIKDIEGWIKPAVDFGGVVSRLPLLACFQRYTANSCFLQSLSFSLLFFNLQRGGKKTNLERRF